MLGTAINLKVNTKVKKKQETIKKPEQLIAHAQARPNLASFIYFKVDVCWEKVTEI